MEHALYAFSGDPITYGHIDIIERAAKIANRLTVGIGANPDKKYLFSLDERTGMARQAVAHLPNVEVTPFDGLLVDYACEHSIPVIIRGLRNGEDLNYELLLHQGGQTQRLGIETVFLPPDQAKVHISSSMAKAIQKEQGLVHELVPMPVKQALEARLSGQYILGVTGTIAAGKSYACERLLEFGARRGTAVHNIDLDKIGHDILSARTEPLYDETRKRIISRFGDGICKDDGMIDRKRLGEIVFSDNSLLRELNEMMRTPLLLRLRKEMYGKKGVLLFNAALIAEADMLFLCNNNALVITVNAETQERRLRERGLDDKQIARRLASQYNEQQKISVIRNAIDRDRHGDVWLHDTSGAEHRVADDHLAETFDQILARMGCK
ncbi:TPA: pantetheine-phosphate adenylyltransferase [Candidatus Woesearchaeota archaeon]|nr:pantetheine-phosphate adenylyltransferase [Candidatus Woesearchaeota archaeon]